MPIPSHGGRRRGICPTIVHFVSISLWWYNKEVIKKYWKILDFNPSTTPLLWASLTLPCTGDLSQGGIGKCIADIYTWSLSVVGIVAFVEIIYGGFLLLTAFGNTNKVGQATAKIGHAILGIVLLFSSYLILRTINPDLVGGALTLPKINNTNPVANTASQGVTRIDNFNVAPVVASLSANTPLAINLSIFASDSAMKTACVAAGYTGSITDIRPGYIVWAVDLSKSPNPKMLFHADPAVAAFGAGKVQSFDFNELIGKTGFSNGGTPFFVNFYAEFTCGNGGVSTVMNTSASINVAVQP